MREYENITISDQDDMGECLTVMRQYGWIYVDSNAVGFTDHYVTGGVYNGYGSFVHHNDHYVNLNLRFVRDTEMPCYKQVQYLYKERMDNFVTPVEPPISSKAATGLFIFFIVLGGFEFSIGLGLTIMLINNDMAWLGLIFLILGLIFLAVFIPLLIAKKVRYKKAYVAYEQTIEKLDKQYALHEERLQEIIKRKDFNAFLDKFEKSLTSNNKE